MGFRFSVLASGSAGNSSLLQTEDIGVLVDIGLGPRQLSQRLAAINASWQKVQAVLLTHVHGDHWNENTFAQLRRQGIHFYCHPEHQVRLAAGSPAFAALVEASLVRSYSIGEEFDLGSLRCRPLALKHDGSVTCGFRFEAATDLFGSASALGYAADLGSWDAALVEALADVDVLALEFNHEVALQRNSGRSPRLILRNLGDHGHLSNAQAALFVREILRRSQSGRLRHLVQLHLSRDCNRPELALEAAQRAVADLPVQIHTACQHEIGPSLEVSPETNGTHSPRRPRPPRKPRNRAASALVKPWLPGWEE